MAKRYDEWTLERPMEAYMQGRITVAEYYDIIKKSDVTGQANRRRVEESDRRVRRILKKLRKGRD